MTPEQALDLLQCSTCFRGDVCAVLPCACAETIAKMATPSASDSAMSQHHMSADELAAINKHWQERALKAEAALPSAPDSAASDLKERLRNYRKDPPQLMLEMDWLVQGHYDADDMIKAIRSLREEYRKRV